MIRDLSAYRSPDEVFYDAAVRMPVRMPDSSFGFLFFDPIKGGRIVGNNGVRHEGRVYRLTSLQKHLEYWGERVDVRINPDDVREAIIYDRRTGAYVCYARLLDEATYDTRDEVTRELIGRVFRDGRELLRMAKAHVDGAKERLAEYRQAKLEFLMRRAAEIQVERDQKKAALAEATPTPATVIGPLSAVARQPEAARTELTESLISEILDRDEMADSRTDACTVSTRRRATKATKTRLGYEQIAKKLGTSRRSLHRYMSGDLPWPVGLKEEFEILLRLKTTGADVTLTAYRDDRQPRRTRSDGEFSYANIAKAIGMTRKMLELCRGGKRPWPEGAKERFVELERQRTRADITK
jgi:hypothetical protein